MNRVQNGGFETAGSAVYLAEHWTFKSDPSPGFAFRAAGASYSGSWGLALLRSPWPRVLPVTGRENGWAETADALTLPDRLYEFGAWVRVFRNAGSELVVTCEGTEVARVSEESAWRRIGGLVTSNGSGEIRFEIQGAGGNAEFHIDDVELEEVSDMSVALHKAYAAYIAQLKTINGGDFYHDLAGRVISRLRPPGTPGDMADVGAYICAPIASNGPIEAIDGNLLEQELVIATVVFPQLYEDSDDTAADLCKWSDDLHRCVLPSDESKPWWHLPYEGESTGIEDVRIRNLNILSEAIDADLPPHLQMDVGLVVRFSRAALGPNA